MLVIKLSCKKIEFLKSIRIYKIGMSVNSDNSDNMNTSSTNSVINFPNVKLIKKTEPVKQIYSSFIEEFLASRPEYLQRWLEFNNQNDFRRLLEDKKFKMRNPNKAEEEKQKKLDKKLKREAKARERQESKVKKAMDRPKQAYYYFLQDEKENIRKRLVEAGNTVNKVLKKLVHVEAQNMWKEFKKSKNPEVQEKYVKYKQIAEEKKAEAERKAKELLDSGMLCACCKNKFK